MKPVYEPSIVFECKYELDSLASFLSLGNQYFNHSGDLSFVKGKWLDALDMVFVVLDEQALSTFDEDGTLQSPTYTFQRNTNVGVSSLLLTISLYLIKSLTSRKDRNFIIERTREPSWP